MLAINYGRKHFERVVIFRPHNVYGPDMGWEHVIPQLVLRMDDLSKKQPSGTLDFTVQGSGKETRAFIFIDDFIDGLMAVLEKGEHLNIYHIGTMDEVSISDLSKEIAKHIGRKIKIIEGLEAKGGTSRRCPDISKLKKLGFSPKTSLTEGLKKTIDWYLKNKDKQRKIE